MLQSNVRNARKEETDAARREFVEREGSLRPQMLTMEPLNRKPRILVLDSFDGTDVAASNA